MKKIAVIVPTFNEEKSLERTLANLKNQTLKDYAVIVKDGLSTDRTVEVAARSGAKVVSKRDVSAGDARNQGAEYAGKDFDVLVFVDADVTLAPDALERIRNDFVALRLSFIIPKFLTRQETIRINTRTVQLPHPVIKFWFAFEHLYRKYADHYGGGMCMPVDARIFRSLGGFRADLKVCEDIEFSYRLGKRAPVFVDDRVLVYVSTRRYLREGVFRGLLTYLLYWAMWHLGISQPLRAEARY